MIIFSEVFSKHSGRKERPDCNSFQCFTHQIEKSDSNSSFFLVRLKEMFCAIFLLFDSGHEMRT